MLLKLFYFKNSFLYPNNEIVSEGLGVVLVGGAGGSSINTSVPNEDTRCFISIVFVCYCDSDEGQNRFYGKFIRKPVNSKEFI